LISELDPIVGNWYRHLDKGRTFRVVALDEEKAIIEIQHFDGDLEEIEASAWPNMDLELAEAPEDWTGPVDDVETDDLGYSETSMKETEWQAPLESNQPSKEAWEDERPEDERDEPEEGDSAEELYGSEP